MVIEDYTTHSLIEELRHRSLNNSDINKLQDFIETNKDWIEEKTPENCIIIDNNIIFETDNLNDVIKIEEFVNNLKNKNHV